LDRGTRSNQRPREPHGRRRVDPIDLLYDDGMSTVSVVFKHHPSRREMPCGACGAPFIPAEDSGSRVLSLKSDAQPGLVALMCGGCASKWVHGTAMTLTPVTKL